MDEYLCFVKQQEESLKETSKSLRQLLDSKKLSTSICGEAANF